MEYHCQLFDKSQAFRKEAGDNTPSAMADRIFFMLQVDKIIQAGVSTNYPNFGFMGDSEERSIDFPIFDQFLEWLGCNFAW